MKNPYRQVSNLQYGVDIVFCIDITASMSPILETVREGALAFPRRLEDIMAGKGKAITQLRVKVIAFRDFGDNPGNALVESDFYLLPTRLRDFVDFLSGLTADGGGDVPESGLEALARAIAAPWEQGLDRRRHVIVVFSDAPAHPLGSPQQTKAPGYPRSIPASLDDLMTQWGYRSGPGGSVEQSAKRLLIFAPEAYPWVNIADDWDNTLFFPSMAGDGLEEWELEEILNTIANSI